MGGAAFEYISVEDTDQNFSRIYIFLLGDVFHLYNIPCEAVYDIPLHIPLKNIESIKLSTTNRCGVQFGKLTKDDRTQLKHFLECHTKNLPF